MYAVVGCSACGNYWLLGEPDEQESAQCGRCGKTHRVDRLKRFHETTDRAEAAEARAALLAADSGDSEAFTEVDHVAELESATETDAVSDDRYLAERGVDPDAAREAGDVSRDRSRSRDDIVRDAVRDHDREDAILDYATDHGVPREAARDLLDRLVRRGEATRAGGDYRLL